MSQNEDNEPSIHTVISDSNNSGSYFNSIAFSMPRREPAATGVFPESGPNPTVPNQEGIPQQVHTPSRVPVERAYDVMSMSMLADDLQSGDHNIDVSGQQSMQQSYQQSQQQYQNLPQYYGNQNPNQILYDNPLAQNYYDNSNKPPLVYDYQNELQQQQENLQSQQIPFDGVGQQSYEIEAQPPISYYNPLSYQNQSQGQLQFGGQQHFENINQPQIYYPDQSQLHSDQIFTHPHTQQIQSQNQMFYNNQRQETYNNSNTSEVIFENPPEESLQNVTHFPSAVPPVISDTNYVESSLAETQIREQLSNLELGVETGGVDLNNYLFENHSAAPPAPENVNYDEQSAAFYKEPLPEELCQTQTRIPSENYSSPQISSDDAIYDMWIPSEETITILKANTEAVEAGTYFPDKDHMTTPGIIYEDDLVDKVGVNMTRIFGETESCKRKILTADSVTQDDRGLRELIKLGCYRSAINLTKRLLTLYGQGPSKVGQFSKQTPHSVQLWFTRISLLMRIREFSIAESEIAAFKNFDIPDLYYEYYPGTYGMGRKGSMIPFHFRLLAAEIPQYVRKFNETANKLNQILFAVQKIIKLIENGQASNENETTNGNSDKNDDTTGETNEIPSSVASTEVNSDLPEAEYKEKAIAIWKKRELRTLYALVNAALFAKDYYNAFSSLSKLCEKDAEHLPQLKSAMGRLFLQHGDLNTAQNYFLEAAELRTSDSETDQVETLIDSALTSIAQNAYPEAFVLFQQALQIQPENFMVTNNMAVCLLYMGKVKDSLALMESTVKQNTPQLLQENVILNLSTIYELENSDGYKKNALLKLISEYKGDGINLASLKMPNLI